MMTRFYYTFSEIAAGSTATGWNKLLSKFGASAPSSSEMSNLYDICANRYAYEAILYVDVDHSPWEPAEKPNVNDILTDEDAKGQILKISTWLSMSRDKYSTLIGFYASNRSKLMDQIKSEGTSRFNDTPQSSQSGGISEEFASTYTKTTAATDGATVAARLDEINRLYINVYEQWADEFRAFLFRI